MTWLALTVALAACVVCVAVLVRIYREVRLLRRMLDDARHDLEHLQSAFERFAPREIVDQIAAQGYSLDAEKRDVTVLFADLKGFTKMSEGLEPAMLVEIINGYFRQMSDAVRAHRGHVAKFIGDGIMALFGAPEPNPWQANDAVHAAIAMRDALRAYNERLGAKGLPTLAIGIGIHRGEVVAGVLGSDQLMEYTVYGRHVNLASRVEGLTRVHCTEILVTEPVKQALDPHFLLRELPPVEVKGVAEPVVTYVVDGWNEVSHPHGATSSSRS